MASFNKKYYSSYLKDKKGTELDFAVEGLLLPQIDVTNIEEIADRSALYFKRCSEEVQQPGVAGLCVWLGITTERWSDWCTGREFGNTHKPYCERIMTLLEANIESSMMNGQINPVTAMFLLKSQFGYIDTPQIKKNVKPSVLREMPIQELLKLAEGGKKNKNQENLS